MKYKPTTFTQPAFYALGLVSSLASIKGTYAYIHHETSDIQMALAASIGLGVIIYACWDVFFNQTGWKKRSAALLIAVVASALSIWTIYQNNQLPILTEQKDQQIEDKTKQEGKSQTIITTLQNQQASINTQIAGLQDQNKADAARMKKLQALLDKGIHPKTNRKAIGQLRTAMTKRNAEIKELQKSNISFTKRLATPEKTPTQEPQRISATIDKAMLSRSSLYEFMTLLFILLGSWYKKENKIKEDQKAQSLADITERYQATIKQIDHKLTDLNKEKQNIEQVITACQSNITQANDTTHLLEKSHRAAQQIKQQTMASTKAAIEAVNETAKQVKSANSAKKSLQNSIGIANDKLLSVDKRADDLHRSSTQSVYDLRRSSTQTVDSIEFEAILKQLENDEIEPSESGYYTDDSLVEATGMSYEKCRNLKIEAYEKGVFDRVKRGNGYLYFKANNNPENVVELDQFKLKLGGQ